MPFEYPRADSHAQNNGDILSLGDEERIDVFGDEFVEAWKTGQVPDIQSYLARETDPPVRAGLFKHLFQLELDLRLNRAKMPSLDAYLARYHDYEDEVREVYAEMVPREVTYLTKFTEKYELLKVIGKGGQGEVHKARQLKAGGRLVALKMIRYDILADESSGVRRFRHEIETVSKMDHPNIVPIYDVGERAGEPYYSMKLIEGGNLDQNREYCGKDWKTIARIMATVARAVHHAHQRGVLHRDIKPSNILLNENKEPHITDFGLAKVIEGTNQNASQSQHIVGTLVYMAPEQAQGKKDLTTAVDVYGLGAVLYELLTGKPPFAGESAFEIIRQVVDVDPPRPAKLRRNVNRDLETICLACMQKDPSKRFYNSAEALANDFERCLRGEPVKARRISKARRAIKWAKRRPGIVALTALLFLVGIGAIGMGLWQWRSTEDALRISERSLYKLHVTLAAQNLKNGYLDQADNQLTNCKAEFRNWEWYFLKRWTQGNVVMLGQHAGRVNAVIYSPNGRFLASASHDGSVLIWDRTDSEMTAVRLFRLKQPLTVEQLAFHPNGDWLACGCSDLTARIWSLKQRKCVKSLPGDGLVVAFSPDGKFLASSGRNGKVRIWTTSNWEQTPANVDHGATVLNLSFTSDNKRLISSGFTDPVVQVFVRVWNVQTGQEEKPLTEPREIVATAQASCTRGRFLAVPKGSSVSVIDLDTKKESHLPGGYNHWCTGMDFSPKNDKTYLVAAFRKGNILIWDVTKRKIVFSAKRGDGVRSVSFNPQDWGEIAYCSDNEVVIEQWQLPQVPTFQSVQAHSQAVRCLAFGAGGRQLATASDDGSIRIWDIDGFRSKTITTGFAGPVTGIDFSPDGKYLAAGAKDKTVKLWSLTTWKEFLIGTHGDAVTSIAFDDDSALLATGSLDGTARVWDVVAKKLKSAFSLTSKVYGVAFRPKHGQLVATGETGKIRIWDVANDTEIHSLYGHHSNVWCVTFSGDGRLLATGGMDDRIILWDAESGKGVFAEQKMIGHSSSVKCVAFNADGKRLASGGLDALIKIWNTSTGEEILTLREHGAAVTSVAFCPQGDLLVSGDENGVVIIRNGTRQ